jgi:hypothetical protein
MYASEYSVWIGGSILASLSTFQQMYVLPISLPTYVMLIVVQVDLKGRIRRIRPVDRPQEVFLSGRIDINTYGPSFSVVVPISSSCFLPFKILCERNEYDANAASGLMGLRVLMITT